MKVRETVWRKSSFSDSQSNCVEVAQGGRTVGVRDSKDRDGGTLTFTAGEWAAFTGAIRRGAYTA